MRILVTGSRNWTDRESIYTALDEIARHAFREGVPEIVVVHGCARGADVMADLWATSRRGLWPVRVERHPADWVKHGRRRAGFVRNHHMVNLGADVCLSFIKDGSPGATHCADAAESAGIRTERFCVRTAEPMPDEVA
ncbi:MAG TPA: DUF2493 domain-containing protein [Jiangellaceae bacterium]|nr:DUF2493 domain-containing protein [Jiangellaceae bacterium]